MKKECEANEIEVGKIYKFSLKNIPLYFAKIEDAGGCWSKIIVTELCESIYKKTILLDKDLISKPHNMSTRKLISF